MDKDVRLCLHCSKESVVLYSRPLGTMELCTLDCHHVCAYPLLGGIDMEKRDAGGAGGSELVCPRCKKRFRTYIRGVFGTICPECRGDFGIRNTIEAEEFLRQLEFPEGAPPKLVRGMVGRIGLTQPKMDPVKMQDMVRSMTNYGVTVPLPTTLANPTTYAIAKNGLFEVRDNDIARIIFQPKEVMGLAETLTPGVTLRIPKVPYEMLQQTVAFFREVCVKMSGTSEALVQIWWNRAERCHLVHVPEQTVSGGGVHHRSEFDRDNKRDAEGASVWLHVMDIHSHGSSMSAFWSSTDDNDEQRAPEGRMFGVIGQVTKPLPEWRWRMRSREGFIDLRVTDVFDVALDKDVAFTVSWGVILDASAEKDGLSADGRVKLLCPVDPFKDVMCPPEWHEKVKGHQFHRGGYMGTGIGFQRYHDYSGAGRGSTLPMYIFIETTDGLLEEFLVDGNSKEPPKPTGKRVIWKPKGEDHVH